MLNPVARLLRAALTLCFATVAAAQPHVTPSVVPFTVGEVLVYHASYAGLPAGKARMWISSIDTVRGRPAYHATFTIDGKVPVLPLYIHDRFDSWFDVATLSAVRYAQKISEIKYRRTTTYEIYPESSTYTKNGGPMLQSVASPLDEFSFIYAVRAAGIVVGETRTDSRYFMPDGNPVVLSWVGQDSVTVGAGTFSTAVVHPSFNTHGLFAQNTDARVWFTDDAHRYPAKVRTKFAKFSVTLSLDSITAGRPPIEE